MRGSLATLEFGPNASIRCCVVKYGQIAGNKSINAMIYRCFEYICGEDVPKFVKKFRDQCRDENLVMHTFRELVLGAYLASSGFDVRHESKVGAKRPDWCVLDGSLALGAIAELTNFHLDRATEDRIERQLQRGNVWLGWLEANDSRLYQSIWHKASAYKALVEEYQVAYIIAVFGEFHAAVNTDELNACLSSESGLFGLYPVLSGVLFFEEYSGRYQFTYMPNPNPLKSLDVPSGEF